ncbi:multicopper oxidase LPR1-like [Gastrolobium bilobum]|uniref:multicopper oxidase LPR1-like n=1 Tax=Gastrolobium bilobum TaxID=150636 RepID=UPI002AB1BC5B|nr:multicopper oxidase LPR1-like [Gastrolobium bilobum]
MERTLLLQLTVLTLILGASTCTSSSDNLINASKLQMFVDELPDMPRIPGYEVVLVDGVARSRSLQIGMFKKIWKFHRDIPPTLVFAFGITIETATVPGPTIKALYGVDTYVTWQNHLPPKHILPWDPTIPTAMPHTKMGVPTVVHLHGGIHEPQSDGNANSWFTFGFQETGPTWTNKTYHYPNNQQPGNLFYHDHAMGLTRVNLVAGLVGAYIIHHPQIEDPLGLPHGDEFDRPLIIFDRNFYTNGSIYMNSTGDNPSIHPQWQPEYFGDVIIVNGKAWPRFTVRRRRYRFRIVNACNARFFSLFFTNGLRFIHVGSDSAYIDKPVITNKTVVGPSEIIDVIVDFSESRTNFANLANDAPYPYPSGNPVNEANNKVMKFIILPHPEVDTSRVPQKLLEYPSADLSSVSDTRYITMYEYTSNTGQPTHLYLNAKPFEAPVTETPKEGSTELWYVINLTGDNHPLHIHLALFKVLDQTELVKSDEFKSCMMRINDALKCHVEKYARGRKVAVPGNEKGWKNVFKIIPGYVTKILVRFSYIHTNASYAFDATAEPGYLYHCHILDHEDNSMMRPFKVIK